MAKKPAKVEAPTREELVALAKEMNNVMGLEPAITCTRKVTDEDLLESIKAEGTGQIFETDFQEDEEDAEKVIFSEAATATLKKLGIEIVVGESAEDDSDDDSEDDEEEETPAPPAKKGKGKKVEPEPEEDEDDEEAPAKPAKKGAKSAPVKEEKPAPAKKGKKVEPEPEEDEDDEEEAPAPKKGAKAAPVKSAKQIAIEKSNAEKKAKLAAKKSDKKASTPKFSRAKSVMEAIKKLAKKSVDFAALKAEAGSIYNANGGNINTESKYFHDVLSYILAALVETEYLTEKDGKYKIA